MPEKPPDKPEETPAAPKKKRFGKKFILIAAGLLVLVGGGVAGGLMFTAHKAKGDKTETAKPVDKELADDATAKDGEGGGKTEGAAGADSSKQSLIFKFDDKFIVNLVDPKGRQFLQASLQLEAASPKGLKQIQDNVAPLRDAIIMLLSSKTRDDIETAAGKERFKRELMVRIDGILEPKAVRNIYITDMLVMSQ